MLEAELRGQPYNKTEHRRSLSKLLDQRSDGSIERKHQNISAILLQADQPYIAGYKPLKNFQGLLRDATELYLTEHPHIFELFRTDVEANADVPVVGDILSCMKPAPKVNEPAIRPARGRRKGVDYLALEGRNTSLGHAGEKFVIDYEKARLLKAGKHNLADRVEHVAKTQGDAAGFDVLSFERNGTDRYIEVKTTKFAAVTPFYVSRNQVNFSDRQDKYFCLYRVFQFRESPKMFNKRGALKSNFRLSPTEYSAALRASD